MGRISILTFSSAKSFEMHYDDRYLYTAKA